MKKFNLLQNPFFIAGVLLIFIVIVTAQSINLPPRISETGLKFTHYNNYLIFKQSYFHLIQNKDLYQLYPVEHWDYYKYSPTFSLLMAPFVYLPDAAGLFLWNTLNVLVLFFALRKLPSLTDKNRLLLLGFILIELITSIQNSQSNALIAGLVIFAFLSLEKKQVGLAALFIVLTVFIKLFGLVAFALFMFYPNKPKAILYTIAWTLLLAILPLCVVPFSQLQFLYQSWLHLLQNDHSASIGFSVAGWLQTWFGVESKNGVVFVGAIIFCLPFLKYKFFKELKFKLFFLASVLLWIVIFNHKAESPTFVIAVSGIAIWFFAQKMKIENLILLSLAFLFTVLSPTDIFPKFLRDNYVTPYVLKAVPCIIIWCKIIFDLLFYKSESNLSENVSQESVAVVK
ncbi:MAG: glycosyltransferase family 87 protein [Bacteroidetes bacterium]|nr:glycosyltransferase family 87 protein [Bacteroidota bacterium]